jgi:hypothetical protein
MLISIRPRMLIARYVQTKYASSVMAGLKAIFASTIGRNSERTDMKQMFATRKWRRRMEGIMAEKELIHTGTRIESSAVAPPRRRRR